MPKASMENAKSEVSKALKAKPSGASERKAMRLARKNELVAEREQAEAELRKVMRKTTIFPSLSANTS